MTPKEELKRLEEALYNSQQLNAQRELRIKELEKENEALKNKISLLKLVDAETGKDDYIKRLKRRIEELKSTNEEYYNAAVELQKAIRKFNR